MTINFGKTTLHFGKTRNPGIIQYHGFKVWGWRFDLYGIGHPSLGFFGFMRFKRK